MVKIIKGSRMDFSTEVFRHQMETVDFFDKKLLDILKRYFPDYPAALAGFDRKGNFSILLDQTGNIRNQTDYEELKAFAEHINHECREQRVSWDKMAPELFLSDKIISEGSYQATSYVKWIEQQLGVYYSVSMPFGKNGCYHLCLFKKKEQGKFTEEELEYFKMVYRILFLQVQAFRERRQLQDIIRIQKKIISERKDAYLICDSRMNILDYNEAFIRDMMHILDCGDYDKRKEQLVLGCVPLLLDFENKKELRQQRKIKGYLFMVDCYVCETAVHYPDIYYVITAEQERKAGTAAETILTEREKEIAHILCEGKSYKEISSDMCVSYHTVKNHIRNIYEKCGVHNRRQLITLMAEQ